VCVFAGVPVCVRLEKSKEAEEKEEAEEAAKEADSKK